MKKILNSKGLSKRKVLYKMVKSIGGMYKDQYTSNTYKKMNYTEKVKIILEQNKKS